MSQSLLVGSSPSEPVLLVDGVEYDVIAGPDDASPLVQLVRTRVAEALAIEHLVSQLSRTDDLLYIAACAVAGVVHTQANQSLSARVSGLQYKLRNGSGKLVSAFASLEDCARNMQPILKKAFADLYGLHEDDALTRLARCQSNATQMAASAAKLEANFQELVEEAQTVLQLTVEACDLHGQELMSVQQRRLEPSTQPETPKTERGQRHLNVFKVEALQDHAAAPAAAPAVSGFIEELLRPVETALGGGMPTSIGVATASPAAGRAQDPPDRHASDAADHMRDAAGYHDSVGDLQRQRHALARIAGDGSTTPSAQDPQQIAQAGVISLRQAVLTLQWIFTNLANQRQRWTGMAADCARLAGDDARSTAEAYMKRTPEERMDTYRSRNFQLHILAVAAQWRALRVVADEYRHAIQKVYEKMGQTYTSNPTIEEARRLAPALGASLADDADFEIRGIERALGAENPGR